MLSKPMLTTVEEKDMHRKAAELIRAAYGMADSMRSFDLSALNESRPPKLRYQSQADLVRDFIGQAGRTLGEEMRFTSKARKSRNVGVGRR